MKLWTKANREVLVGPPLDSGPFDADRSCYGMLISSTRLSANLIQR
jgi:hypothetical protein